MVESLRPEGPLELGGQVTGCQRSIPSECTYGHWLWPTSRAFLRWAYLMWVLVITCMAHPVCVDSVEVHGGVFCISI